MTPTKPVWYFHAMALFTVLVWSWSYVHVIWLARAVGPGGLVALRLDAFGVALLLLWFIRRPSLRHITRRQWLNLVIVGFVSYPAYHFPLAWGGSEGRTEAALIGLIIATIPVHVGWLAWLLLRERLTPMNIIALLLGLVGVTTVVVGKHGLETLVPSNLAGPLAVTIAAIMGAGIATLNRGARHILKPMDLVTVGGTIGFLFGLPLHLDLTTAQLSAMTLVNWWQVFFLGFIAIGICYVTWITALSGLRTVNVAMYLFLAAILSAFWGWLLQGNEIGPAFFIGAALVLAGLLTMVATTLRQSRANTATATAAPTGHPAEDPA
jgi:drug/metabolite transporter (DMT)-like permease